MKKGAFVTKIFSAFRLYAVLNLWGRGGDIVFTSRLSLNKGVGEKGVKGGKE